MLRDQRIDQSETSIQSLLNTNGASFFDDTTRKIDPLDFTLGLQLNTHKKCKKYIEYICIVPLSSGQLWTQIFGQSHEFWPK